MSAISLASFLSLGGMTVALTMPMTLPRVVFQCVLNVSPKRKRETLRSQSSRSDNVHTQKELPLADVLGSPLATITANEDHSPSMAPLRMAPRMRDKRKTRFDWSFCCRPKMETRGFLMRMPVRDSVSTLEEDDDDDDDDCGVDVGLEAGAARVFFDGGGGGRA